MGVLNKALNARKEADKKKYKSSPYSVANAMPIPTGFPVLDARLSTVAKDSKSGEQFVLPGLSMGKLTLAVGNSQSGKSTIAYQIASNMANYVDEVAGSQVSDIVVLDFERSTNNLQARIESITGTAEEDFDTRFTVIKENYMSTEWLKDFFFSIKEAKSKLTAADMVDWQDEDGQPIKIYPPTFVIVDSIPSIRTIDVMEDATLDNNMVGGKIANANNSMLIAVNSFFEEYNINVIAINHVTKKIKVNAYGPREVILPGLPEDVNLPGGNKWVFYSSYAFWLTSGAEYKEDKDFYEAGRKTSFRMLKTRSGFNNDRLEFFLSAKVGFSAAITTFLWLKEEGYLQGGGRSGFTLKGLEGYAFTQKSFVEQYYNDEEFRTAFDEKVDEIMMDVVMNKYSKMGQAPSKNSSLADEFDDE